MPAFHSGGYEQVSRASSGIIEGWPDQHRDEHSTGSPGLLPDQVSLKPTSSLEQSKANTPALVLLATCLTKY